jgi:hypothetical protein
MEVLLILDTTCRHHTSTMLRRSVFGFLISCIYTFHPAARFLPNYIYMYI